jgi:prepilin signal peptidase PulO-like enzyme (type II secretory pathway)
MAIGALIVQGRAADLALRLAGWVSFQVSWLLVAIWPRAVVPVLNVAGGTASGTERGPTRLPYGPAIAIGGIVAILLGGG